MDFHDYKYDKIKSYIAESTMFELLEMYREQKKKFLDKCVDLTRTDDNSTDKEKLRQECEYLQGKVTLIGLAIADKLTR